MEGKDVLKIAASTAVLAFAQAKTKAIEEKNVFMPNPIYSNYYDPIGVVDRIECTGPHTINVDGWAADQDCNSESIRYMVYVGDYLVGEWDANLFRSDVNAALGITGNHGFSQSFQTNLTGNQTVRVYAVDLNKDSKVLLKQQTIFIQEGFVNMHLPIGAVTKVQSIRDQMIDFEGYAFDEDQPQVPVKVVAYIGSTFLGEVTSNKVNPEINQAYQIEGNVGFSGSFYTPLKGDQTVTFYAIDPTTQEEREIGSMPVQIKSNYTTNHAPTGCVDAINGLLGGVEIGGWTYDLDEQNASLMVRIYVNGQLVDTLKADQVRDDVNRVKGVSGNHGFSKVIPLSNQGNVVVSVRAVDLQTNKEYTLQTKTVTVTQEEKRFKGIGVTDRVIVEDGGKIYVAGWGYNYFLPTKTAMVQVELDGKVIGELPANQLREDVNIDQNISGSHGFSGYVNTDQYGKHTIKLYLVDQNSDARECIGTRNVEIKKDYATKYIPQGWVDTVELRDGRLYGAGWAFDQDDLSDPTEIRFYANKQFIGSMQANQPRDDVNKAKNVFGQHGYSGFIDYQSTGIETIEVYAVDLGTNQERLIGSKNVVFTKPITTNYAPQYCVDQFIYSDEWVDLSGWAFDRDSLKDSLIIKIADGDEVVKSFIANKERDDVNKVFNIFGSHGFSERLNLPLSVGKHTLRVLVEDLVTKKEVELTRKEVFIEKKYTNMYQPQYAIDNISIKGSILGITGWVFDRDGITSSMQLNIYIDHVLAGTANANLVRDDVNKVFSIEGNHGFDAHISTSLTGNHEVRVTVIDLGSDQEIELAKKVLNFPLNKNNLPIGVTDQIKALGKSVNVAGWCFDPDGIAVSNQVAINVDGKEVMKTYTTIKRDDVNALFGTVNNHGFNLDIPLSLGKHYIEVYAIDINGVDRQKIGSAEVNVVANSITTLALAEAEIGKYVGGAYYNKWFDGFENQDYWCAVFVSYIARQAGIPTSIIAHTKSVYVMRKQFVQANKCDKFNPQPGDLIFFRYDKSKYTFDHVGFVEKVEGNRVYTIEGNFGQGTDPSKHVVGRGSYDINDDRILDYGHMS